MSFEVGRKSFDIAEQDEARGRRNVGGYVELSKAYSIVATLVQTVVATARAEPSCDDDDRAWVAQHRVW